MVRKSYVALIVLIVAASAIFVNQYKVNTRLLLEIQEIKENQMDYKESVEKQLMESEDIIDQLKAENSQLIDKIEKMRTFDSSDEDKYRFLGIKDTSVVVEDLLKHPELINYDAVLGGTMFFYKATVINYKYAYAKFEDGHIGGHGLYEYQIDENGDIKWKIIIAELN